MTNSIAATAAQPDRRQFLVGTGAAALAALLISRPERALAEAIQGFHIPHLGLAATPRTQLQSFAEFASHVGSRFVVRSAEFGAVHLTLVDVTQAQPDALLTGEAFSMLFVGSLASPISGAQQQLHHSVLGSRPFYLLPVGQAIGVQHYQAIIDTRVVTPGATASNGV